MKISLRRKYVKVVRYIVGTLFILFGKPLLNRGLTAFVFHEVSDTPRLHAWETHTYSDVKTFGKQIDWITKFFEVRDLRMDGSQLDDAGCLVTFDDGYRGLLDSALKILKEKKVPAVCFINMATILGGINSSALAMYVASRENRAVRWQDSNPRFYTEMLENLTEEDHEAIRMYQGPYLNSEQLKGISDSPLITIGDHFYNHWLLEALSQDEIGSELAKSWRELQAFAACRQIFAAPHGVSSSQALNYLKKSGFRMVFSGKEVHHMDSLSVYPRIDLNNEISNVQQFFGAIAVSKVRIWMRQNPISKS